MKQNGKLARLLALALALSLLASCGPGGSGSGGAGTSQPGSAGSGDPSGSGGGAEVTQASDYYATLENSELFELDFSPADEEGNIVLEGRDATGTNGVVVSASVHASRAGLEIIMAGGNAIDAAVATSFAMTVVEPFNTSMGGGGFMNIALADGTNLFLDGREIAPMAASPDMWQLDEDGNVIGDQKKRGGKAAATPTMVALLTYALENYGTMTLEEVMAPAIRLAEYGFEVTPTFRETVVNNMSDLNRFIYGAEIYLPDGMPHEVGTIFTNPEMAETLKTIAEGGAEAFYTGEIADAIIENVTKFGGLMTHDDLLKAMNEQPVVREAVEGTYRGYQIAAPAPVSSGGTHVVQILNILENYDMSEVAVNSAEYIHRVTEATRLAFMDRAAYMGDPAFVDLPIYGLTNKDYAKELFDTITPLKAGHSDGPGDPWAYETGDSPYVTHGNTDSGYPDTNESTETTHISIADKDGNMVSMTQTIQTHFGSCVFVDGYGFGLNNQCNDFTVGWESPNRVEGGKKPLSSMSPTIIRTAEGDPFMVIGTPGATRIFPHVVQTITKVIDYDMDIQDAISSFNFAWDHANQGIWVNNAECPLEDYDAVMAELEAMGYKIIENTGESRLCGIVYQEDGTLRGGADPRGDCKALGY